VPCVNIASGCDETVCHLATIRYLGITCVETLCCPQAASRDGRYLPMAGSGSLSPWVHKEPSGIWMLFSLVVRLVRPGQGVWSQCGGDPGCFRGMSVLVYLGHGPAFAGPDSGSQTRNITLEGSSFCEGRGLCTLAPTTMCSQNKRASTLAILRDPNLPLHADCSPGMRGGRIAWNGVPKEDTISPWGRRSLPSRCD
jgi:hypothetical protein